MDDDAELWKGLIGWAHAHEKEAGIGGAQAKLHVDFERPDNEFECLGKRAKVLQSCMLGDKGA